MTTLFTRHPFTVTDYYRMAEVGILTNDEQVELFEGDIVLMTPFSPQRAACTKRLNAFLHSQIWKKAILSIRHPVRFDEYTELCPNAVLLKSRDDFYSKAHPSPEDTLILIAILDASASHSHLLKYAQAGVPEFWLVDLVNNRIEVHALPNEGVYQEVRIILRHQNVISRMLPQLKLKASDILG